MIANPSSFRDPSSSVFQDGETVYRAIFPSYKPDYRRFMDSGLYRDLEEAGFIVPHEEVGPLPMACPEASLVVRPMRIPFVSYPYEWSFSQLKDAGRLTLEIQSRALARGMTLKDASAFNVQFLKGRPIFIDTASFETYAPGQPWAAYHQFCRHFIAPLALMSRIDLRLGQMTRWHLDGIPLDLATSMLKWSGFSSATLWIHIFLHSNFITRYRTGKKVPAPAGKPVKAESVLQLLDHMKTAIEGMEPRRRTTQCVRYYEGEVHSGEYTQQKAAIVKNLLEYAQPLTLWDLGANTGYFSQIAASLGIRVISFEKDPVCVEASYGVVKSTPGMDLLPVVMDLSNPTPGLGWDHTERDSLKSRGPADMVMVLALIHHLCVGANIPLEKVIAFLRQIGQRLIIEFVPKEDEKVRLLLRSRADIFPDYNRDAFERYLGRHFTIRRVMEISHSPRVIYYAE
jgi:hypothetical protein